MVYLLQQKNMAVEMLKICEKDIDFFKVRI